MDLPKITDIDVADKRVLVRADLDVSQKDNYRLEVIIPTLKFLSEKGARIILLGHRDRPEGKVVEGLRMKPVEEILKKITEGIEFTMLENLRFDPGEESNNLEFTKRLAQNGEVYINDAFATSHRDSASITGLPKLLPHAAGLRFTKEVENLSRVLANPRRPVVFIVGGSKKDKLDYIEHLKKIADKILVGGRLPEYMGDEAITSVGLRAENEKIIIGNLMQDKEDITIHSIERFEEEIKKAGTIVLAGPMGRYEEEGHRQGTERIFKAVSESSAYKVTGGGDSLIVVQMYKLSDKFDWVSVGGGAMLEFLAKGTLPGIEALLH